MKNLRETRMPLSPCPYCDYPIDCATAADPDNPDAVPDAGDMTVCMSCAQILVFTESLGVRKPYQGEAEAALAEDPDLAKVVRRAQAAVRHLDRRNLNADPEG